MYCADNHVHTCFSFDGAPGATPDAVCRAAIDRGMQEITFTDHCDINGEVEGIYPHFTMEEARDAVFAAKETYRGRLRVNWGIELGQPHQYPDAARKMIADGGFDFVLGSLHNLTGVPDFFFLKYELMTDEHLDRLFSRCLDETMEVVKFSGIHALAHLTYPCRYYTLAGRSFDPMRYTDRIAEIFSVMREKSIALEINSSTLRKGLGFTLPYTPILALWRECGGEMVTFGSDAHAAEDVGADFAAFGEMMRTCGFSSYFTFRDGAPVEHTLA